LEPKTAPRYFTDHYGTEVRYALSLPTLLRNGKADPEPGGAEFLPELPAVV